MKKPHQIHVMYTAEDGRANGALARTKGLGSVGKGVTKVVVVDTYTIAAKLTKKQLETAANALHTPLSQKVSINEGAKIAGFSQVFEIGFLPGVTDNVGNTTRETLENVLKRSFKKDEAVYSSRQYFLSGKVEAENMEAIAAAFHNPLIERAASKSAKEALRLYTVTRSSSA